MCWRELSSYNKYNAFEISFTLASVLSIFMSVPPNGSTYFISTVFFFSSGKPFWRTNCRYDQLFSSDNYASKTRPVLKTDFSKTLKEAIILSAYKERPFRDGNLFSSSTQAGETFFLVILSAKIHMHRKRINNDRRPSLKVMGLLIMREIMRYNNLVRFLPYFPL